MPDKHPAALLFLAWAAPIAVALVIGWVRAWYRWRADVERRLERLQGAFQALRSNVDQKASDRPPGAERAALRDLSDALQTAAQLLKK